VDNFDRVIFKFMRRHFANLAVFVRIEGVERLGNSNAVKNFVFDYIFL
jgi:hypothetical protein